MKKNIIFTCFALVVLLVSSCGGSSGSVENYTFNMTNRVAQAYPDKCTNGIVAFEVKFLKDGLLFVRGTDSTDAGPGGTCIAKQTDPSEIGLIATYERAKNDGFLVPCNGPICTLAQLNATYTGTDVDGRAWTQVVSHVKNSNEIVSTKSWLQGQAEQISKVTLKFVDDGYFIDLTSKTASVYAMACTPPIVAFKARFTSDGMLFTEGTDSVNGTGANCTAKQTPNSDIGVTYLYAEVKRDGFVIPCGTPVCTLWELNGSYTGTDVDGRAWTQVVSHIKGSKEILSTKSWIQNGVSQQSASRLVID